MRIPNHPLIQINGKLVWPRYTECPICHGTSKHPVGEAPGKDAPRYPYLIRIVACECCPEQYHIEPAYIEPVRT